VEEINEGVKALDSDARAIAMVSDNQTAARITEAGTRVLLRATAMVTAAKVLAPYIETPEAVEQMVYAAKLLSQDIKQLTQLCNVSKPCFIYQKFWFFCQLNIKVLEEKLSIYQNILIYSLYLIVYYVLNKSSLQLMGMFIVKNEYSGRRLFNALQ